MQQEVPKVKIAVGAAHLTEVDDAAVAAGVTVDVGDVQIPMGQVPHVKRPLLLACGKRAQSVQLARSNTSFSLPGHGSGKYDTTNWL